MSIWQRLLQTLGWKKTGAPPSAPFQLDAQVIHDLQFLAKRQQRPEGEIAADLVASEMARLEEQRRVLRIWDRLTPRERQVTQLICRNYTNQQMAGLLVISSETTKTHVRNVLRKFGVHNRTELQALLADYDWVPVDE